MAFGLDFGSSKQKSKSDVWGPQSDALKSLYGAVTPFWQNQNPNLQNALDTGSSAIPGISGYTSNALPAWNNFLQGGSFAGFNPNIAPVNEMAGAEGAGFDTYESLMTPGGNPWLDAMAQSGLGRLFDNYSNVVKPQTDLNYAFGGYGGSRQGVENANNINNLFDSSTDFLTGLYGGQYQSDMNRALAAASGYNNDQMAAINAAGGFGAQANTTGVNALGQGQNAANLGFAAPNYWNSLYQMQQQPYTFASGIYGDPTTIGSSKGSSDSYGLKF